MADGEQHLRLLAAQPHVMCKVAGLATEAGHATWSSRDIRPVWDTPLSAFGPERLMVGSDWPLCLLAGGWNRWGDAVQDLQAWDPAAVDVPELVREWTGDAGADVAFEVSGAAGGVETAVDVLGVRGRLCMVAIHPRPREVNLHRFFWREPTRVGARLYDRSDFERAVALVADGTIPADRLISKVVAPAEAPSAFEALEEGGDVMKILVDCGDSQGARA